MARRQRNGIVLERDGQVLWTLDPTQFEPGARATIIASGRDGKAAAVELLNARYAGLALSLTVRLTVTQGDHRLQVSCLVDGLSAVTWSAEVPLFDWLDGRAVPQATLTTAQAREVLSTVHTYGLGVVQQGAAPVHVALEPSLGLRLIGPLELQGVFGAVLPTRCIGLAPLPGDAPSLLARPASRRTLLTADRGAAKWQIDVQKAHADGWEIRGQGSRLFDSVRAELSRQGAAIQLLPSGQPKGRLRFHPIAGQSGMLLDQPSVVIARIGEEESYAVVAGFAAQAGWIAAGTGRVQLGADPETEPLQVAFTQHGTQTLICCPAVRTLVLPLPGASTLPINLQGQGLSAQLRYEQLSEHAHALVRPTPTREPLAIVIPPNRRPTVSTPFDFTVDILRHDDLLALNIGFANARLTSDTRGTRVVAKDTTKPMTMIVTFPPQHVAEHAYPEHHTPFDEPGRWSKPTESVFANTSRLAFRLPTSVTSLDYTTASLLDWSRFTLIVAPTAALSAPRGAQIAAPSATETALEIPERLILSPNEKAGWVHAFSPVVHNNRTELWHTRLAVRLDDGHGGTLLDETTTSYRTLRAIWSPDVASAAADISPLSLAPSDRVQLVKLMATRYSLFRSLTTAYDSSAVVPAETVTRPDDSSPATVNKLMLTALGAWMDVHGHWDPTAFPYGSTPGLSVEDWTHIVGMGRDAYVRVMYGGCLLPFGHRATLIKVVERQYFPDSVVASAYRALPGPGTSVGPGVTAYLVERVYVVVREQERDYGDPTAQTPQGRAMPFQIVRILTKTTPDLALDATANPPIPIPALGSTAGEAFWPSIDLGGGQIQPFLFQLTGTDRAGNTVTWTQQLAFLDEGFQANPNDIISAYNRLDPLGDRRLIQMNGQKIAYAVPSATEPHATTFPTESISFGIAPQPFSDPHRAHLLPTIAYDNPITDPQTLAYSMPVRRLQVTDVALRSLSPSPDPLYNTQAQALIQCEALSQIAGQDAGTALTYTETYITHGFDPAYNNGEVFLGAIPGASCPAIHFSADQVGGVAAPNFTLVGHSRLLGPVTGDPKNPDGSLKTQTTGGFDPTQCLKDAVLLGGLVLSEIVQALAPGGLGSDPSHAPVFKSQKKYKNPCWTDPKDATSKPDGRCDLSKDNTKDSELTSPPSFDPSAQPVALETFLQWSPKLNGSNPPSTTPIPPFFGILIPSYKGVGVSLSLKASVRTELITKVDAKITKGGTPSDPNKLKVEGALNNFSIVLLAVHPLIQVDFNSFTFSYSMDKGFEPKPDIDGVQFLNELSFISKLKDYLAGLFTKKGGSGSSGSKGSSFGVSPIFDLGTDHITVGANLALPSVSVGVFALKNLKLGAAMKIPFSSPVEFDFNFCKREDPFSLSVYGIGGGGFFALGIAAASDDKHHGGLKSIEAAFEFGANISIDLGVASGGVFIKAGIYYSYDSDPKKGTQLQGYLKMGGCLSVLGLITASLEFDLTLTYKSVNDSVAGDASLKIEIDIFFFSASVTLSVHKEFAGGGASGQPAAMSARLPGMAAALPAAGSEHTFADIMSSQQWGAYAEAFA